MNYTMETIPEWLVKWAVIQLRHIGVRLRRSDYREVAFRFCRDQFRGDSNEDIREFVWMERAAARQMKRLAAQQS